MRSRHGYFKVEFPTTPTVAPQILTVPNPMSLYWGMNVIQTASPIQRLDRSQIHAFAQLLRGFPALAISVHEIGRDVAGQQREFH
jgi:hypothetical protein